VTRLSALFGRLCPPARVLSAHGSHGDARNTTRVASSALRACGLAAMVFASALFAASCGDVEPGLTQAPIRVSNTQARRTLEGIREGAAREGITNFLAIALLAEEETGLDHCGAWACQGPAHADCGGRPVISGGGDGPCSINQGGIGMFQLDQGTESQTVAYWRGRGVDVLSIDGNTQAALRHLISRLIDPNDGLFGGLANDRAAAIRFLNRLRVGDRNWDDYIRFIIYRWNGCKPGWSCYANRWSHYSSAAPRLLRTFGRSFFYGNDDDGDRRDDEAPSPPSPGLNSQWLASPLASVRVTSPVVINSRDAQCNFNSRGTHKGTDMGVPSGTTVRSSAPGTVLYAYSGCPNSFSPSCGGGYGNHVIVRHAGGFGTLYAHLSRVSVRSGTRVDCGDVLGRSGNSGHSFGAHLHYEVRRDVGTSAGSFYGAAPLTPWGGRCGNSGNMWVGGSPRNSCEGTVAPRDDARFVRARHRRTVRTLAGSTVTQIFRIRNNGNTTWQASTHRLIHHHGSFRSVREVRLRRGTSVRPGQSIRIRVRVRVAERSGTYTGFWRMARPDRAGQDGYGSNGGFGDLMRLSVRVRQPRACRVSFAGRIDHGECVELPSIRSDYTLACGVRQCVDGTLRSTKRRACSAVVAEAPLCEDAPPPPPPPPPPDGGMCMATMQACTSSSECCTPLSCSLTEAGATCCTGANLGCTADADCCGTMACVGGTCACRAAGESCLNHLDCCGAALCTGGVCVAP
jgi:murein DD-endopeptidase MepM/ murein hydrolase activator NlpD